MHRIPRGILALALLVLAASATLVVSPANAGDVLACGWSSHNIVRYDDTGALVGTFAAPGTGGLTNAHSLEQGPDGMIYVTSAGSDAVLRFDPVTADVESFVSPGEGGMDSPFDAIFGPDGLLYVVSSTFNMVVRYDMAGAVVDTFVTPGAGGLSVAEMLAFDASGRLYVASDGDDSVKRYSTTGVFEATVVAPGLGGLNGPHDIAIHPVTGNLLVTSFGNAQVLEYDVSGAVGTFEGAFVTPGSGGVSGAHGLHFGPGGDLYVSSFFSNEVLRYDGTTGTFIEEFVAAGTGITGATAVLFLADAPVAVPQTTAVPVDVRAYPNPTSAVQTISVNGMVTRAVVLDVAGRQVRSLPVRANGSTSTARWDGLDADGRASAPGVYFARLSTTAGPRTVRLVRSR